VPRAIFFASIIVLLIAFAMVTIMAFAALVPLGFLLAVTKPNGMLTNILVLRAFLVPITITMLAWCLLVLYMAVRLATHRVQTVIQGMGGLGKWFNLRNQPFLVIGFGCVCLLTALYFVAMPFVMHFSR
jgi:hypothetical protein